MSVGADKHRDIRDALRALCAQFPATYHREVDAARGYPEAFVSALTKAGSGTQSGTAGNPNHHWSFNLSLSQADAKLGHADFRWRPRTAIDAALQQIRIPDTVRIRHHRSLYGHRGAGLAAHRYRRAVQCRSDGAWL